MNHQVLRVARYILAGVILFCVAPAAYGATLYVSNRGVDAPSCGTAADRCRSISQAIANASPGDTIMVGPGVYGDIDGDGLLGDPGEETGSPGCGCVLSVNKSLIVLSSDGAAATVINASNVLVNTNVLIIAGPVEFGRPNHGFTVTKTGNSGGIVVDGSNVKVRGNQAVGGLLGGVGTGIRTIGASEIILIESNQVIGWDIGISVNGTGKTVNKNHVSLNALGIFASGAASVTGNVVVANGTGLSVHDAESVVQNAFNGNQNGIFVQAGVTSFFSGTIAKNNIFGNSGCGVINFNGTGLPGVVVIATNNYWGAAGGPGADPADTVCSSGNPLPATTTTPFATTPFVVNPEFEP